MKAIKTIILIAVMGMFSYQTMAQKIKEVPQAVQSDFSAKYPEVQVKKWQIDHGQYLASFKLNGRECIATYSPDGTWVSTETTMRHIKNLSPDIKASLRNSKFSSYNIDVVKDIKTPTKDMYMLEVDNNSGNKMLYDNIGSFDDELLYFSHSGQLIKSVNNSNQ